MRKSITQVKTSAKKGSDLRGQPQRRSPLGVRHRLLNTLIGKQDMIGAETVGHTRPVSFNITTVAIPL